jgi:hypothetical protein
MDVWHDDHSDDNSGGAGASVRVVPVPRRRLRMPIALFLWALSLSFFILDVSHNHWVSWLSGLLVGSTAADLYVAWRSA